MSLLARAIDPETGLLCCEDGKIFIPQGPTGRRSHWTFGTRTPNGYRLVGYMQKNHLAHRVICRAFHGVPDEGYEVDHIDGDRSNNRPGNLRWVPHSENMRNTGHATDKAVAKYERSNFNKRYNSDPDFHKRHNARSLRCANEHNAQLRAAGFVKKKDSNGKFRWYPKDNAAKKEKE